METPRKNGLLDDCSDTRQGKAEAIQDYINREEVMSLSLQNSTKIALDEKMRGYWPIRTSALSEQEIAGPNRHQRKHWTVCWEEGDPAYNRCGTERGCSR